MKNKDRLPIGTRCVADSGLILEVINSNGNVIPSLDKYKSYTMLNDFSVFERPDIWIIEYPKEKLFDQLFERML